MDENMKSNSNVHGVGCMCCMHHVHGWHGYGHGPWHIIIKVVVLVVVFWLGMQVGAMHALYGGYGMMGGYGGYYRHAPMMDGYGNYYYGPTSATSSTQ